MFDPSDGYPVTSANLSLAEDFEITEFPDPFLFTSDVARDIRAWIINNNSMYGQAFTVTELSKTLSKYQDEFIFRMSWGYWSYDMDAISYEQVISDQQGGTNMSVSVFYLAGDSYSLLVGTGGDATTHESLIWNNQFNISIGHDTSTIDTVTSASFWSILGQMMSASLPNTHWIINYLVSAIMWSAIGFMAIVVIVWFIPF